MPWVRGSVRYAIGTALLLLGSWLSICVPAAAQHLNLTEGTLEKLRLCETTVDSVTDLLGRPSFVDQPLPIVRDITGPSIYYHDLGLGFYFRTKKQDTNQRLESLRIYLSRSWDDDSRRYFQPFLGRLEPPLNANMKYTDVRKSLEALGFTTSLRSPDEAREEWEKIKSILPFDAGDGSPFYWTVAIDAESHRTVFLHEEVTGFLESVALRCSSPTAQSQSEE